VSLRTIAALYVQTGGCYFGLDGVDPWDAERDARLYAGPHPVVAHPPCQRWGRFWAGSPYAIARGKRLVKGDDNGCFAAALAAVRAFGGVLEHPEASQAWRHFGLMTPPRDGRWVSAGLGDPGWTCCVEQGHYGHPANKPTWLYAAHVSLPELVWGRGEQRLDAQAVERHGYAKARRMGALAHIGGGGNAGRREATPPAFRDLLLGIARTAQAPAYAEAAE
jgi:hypothetical protein